MKPKNLYALLNEIKNGHAVMTREDMVDLVSALSDGPGIGDSMEDITAFEEAWLTIAKPAWIDFLFDIVAYPPAERSMGEPEYWDTSIGALLENIIPKFPTEALEKIKAVWPTEDRTLRAVLAYSFGLTRNAASLPYLRPLLNDIDKFDDQELTYFVDALACITERESYEVLKTIRQTQYAERAGLCSDIDVQLERMGNELDNQISSQDQRHIN